MQGDEHDTEAGTWGEGTHVIPAMEQREVRVRRDLSPVRVAAHYAYLAFVVLWLIGSAALAVVFVTSADGFGRWVTGFFAVVYVLAAVLAVLGSPWVLLIGVVLAAWVLSASAVGFSGREGSWLLLVWLAASVVEVVFSLVHRRWHIAPGEFRYMMRTQWEAVPQEHQDRLLRVAEHGTAGMGIAQASRFGSAAKVGAAGERQGASVLRDLLDRPDVTIVHNLSFPGSDTADVDHAVICGRRVALVDSKAWRSGLYELDVGDTITRDGVHIPEGDSAMTNAISGYQRQLQDDPHLSQVEVRGWVLLTRVGGQPTIQNPGEGLLRLATEDNICDELESWFGNPDPPMVDLHLIHAMVAARKVDHADPPADEDSAGA